MLVMVAMMAALLGLPAGAAPAGNLIADGDFERAGLSITHAGGAGAWVGTIHGKSDAAFALAAGEGRDASRCVRYRKTEAGNQNIHLDQVVPVARNTVYEVSAWMRSEGSHRPLLAVLTMGWGPLAQTVCEGGPESRHVRLLFHSYENDQVRLEWFPGAEGRLYTGVAGTSWLDDVSLRPLDPVPPAVRQALEVARPRAGNEVDTTRIRPTPVGRPRGIRPISCRDGVLVYDDGSEVALWGVNFQPALSWEYNGRLKPVGVPLEAEALKRITDENFAQIRMLGVGVVRLHLLPSDFSDAEGNLRDSVYLDVLAHILAKCHEAGIYAYLTLINEMSTRHFPDSFMVGKERREWLFDPEFVSRTERYVAGLLGHKNRYTGRAYADDPAIAVIEVMNEPAYPDYASLRADAKLAPYRAAFEAWAAGHGLVEYPEAGFPAWRYAVVKGYLARICAALPRTGSRHPVIWNLNWPRMIGGHEDVFQAAADSPVDGVSFCLYPGQEDVPSPFWANPMELSDRNYLPFLGANVAEYARLRWILGRRFAGKAKLVYEFETFYNQTGYLYPAMARLMRSLGVQIAPMWHYSLTPVAEYAGGSHYLNVYCTPRKAASFAIAGRVFERTPRFAPYDTAAKEEMAFDGCFLSFPRNLSVLRTPDTLMHSGPVDALPAGDAGKVRHILGWGSSPLVSYDGPGLYRVEVGEDAVSVLIHPDATFLRPHWQRPHGKPWERLCALDANARHRFVLRLPDWRGNVAVTRIEGDRRLPVANEGPALSFGVTAGRYEIVRKVAD